MATQLYNVWVRLPKQMSFQLLTKCCEWRGRPDISR